MSVLRTPFSVDLGRGTRRFQRFVTMGGATLQSGDWTYGDVTLTLLGPACDDYLATLPPPPITIATTCQ